MIDILSLLEGVRESGGDNYLACCPAHEDRSPSLSVKICADGRTLLHCFAGCEVESVVAALDLKLSDLMPERIGDNHAYSPVRRSLPARDALAAMDHNALVVAIVGADMLEHREIDEPTWSRLAQAVARINAARAASVPLRLRR